MGYYITFYSPSSSPLSRRTSLSIATVIFQEQSADSPAKAHIAIEHRSQYRWHLVGRLSENKDPCRANWKRNDTSEVDLV